MSAPNERAEVRNDPLNYAPPWLRERPEPRVASADEPASSREAATKPAAAMPSAALLDAQLESAVYESLHRRLDPEIIEEPPELARELGRQGALFGVAIRFAAAIGVSAAAALFFVFVVSTSRQPTDTSLSSVMQSVKAAAFEPIKGADQPTPALKPALAQFRTVIASSEAGRAATHAETEKLLQQFMQWRQKANLTEPQR